tara:strand:+ start:2714 stop:3007 length:294 start_codon:yes stop_codon:yes gene_type:complete
VSDLPASRRQFGKDEGNEKSNCHDDDEFGHLVTSNKKRGSRGCVSTRGRVGLDQDLPGVSPISVHPAADKLVPGSDFKMYVPIRLYPKAKVALAAAP